MPIGSDFFWRMISVFEITDENNIFSISIPGHWRIPNYLEDGIFDELRILLYFRSQNDMELHVEEVRKRENQTRFVDKEYKLSDLDTSKTEILEKLKSANYHDLEDLVYRMGLKYD